MSNPPTNPDAEGREMIGYVKTPVRPFRWLRGMFCDILGHRWLVNSDNDWRCCSHCRTEQRRARNAVWKD